MRSHIRKLIGIVLLGFAVTVAAADLGSAKSAGQVGEQLDGYLGLVDKGAPADVRELVDSVNRERRKSYEAIARKNNLDLATVEKLAAEKAIKRTESGHFIQSAPGQWVRK